MALVSCKENKKRTEAEQIVAEWMGKEIQFPEDFQCSFAGNDTISTLCADLFQSEYKVLLYVDSSGCSSCKLKLFEWQQVIADADSLFGEKLSFLLFFQPKNKKEMEFMFKSNKFDYFAFIDMNNRINQLNHFPSEQSYQCFLLDKDNRVLMIGNPMLNPKIWELYKAQISGNETKRQENLTSVETDKISHDFGNIPLGESSNAVFQLKNTGDFPMIINHVSTSCGCTAVEWEKQPIEAGKTADIKVEIKPEEDGYFNKTIDVYCNVKESPIKLTISGTANK
ncbi:hypothetical protein FACS189426_16840 [Bacteroidia bacterium]|nr:hypothetical protein FACS189426_16840 [Bacteroidia bacterium]